MVSGCGQDISDDLGLEHPVVVLIEAQRPSISRDSRLRRVTASTIQTATNRKISTKIIAFLPQSLHRL